MALSSFRCFDAVGNALQAIQYGKTSEAALILRSVKSDARLMQNELRKYHQIIEKTEKQYEKEAERLTREINQIYRQEQEMRRQERELNGLKERLHSQNESNVESRNEAERRYKQARAEEERAREKYEFHKGLYWIPIVNIFVGIAEAIEQNGERAREARADMECYQRRINEENDDIRSTNLKIWNIQAKIDNAQREAQSLKQKRDSYHDKLSVVKSTTVFVLDAIYVSGEILNLTESATVKTENLERIMHLAAKKNTLKVLQSGGMKTKIGSFKECSWEEIADKVQSSSLLLLEDELYLE